jgi:hypothetical protein
VQSFSAVAYCSIPLANLTGESVPRTGESVPRWFDLVGPAGQPCGSVHLAISCSTSLSTLGSVAHEEEVSKVAASASRNSSYQLQRGGRPSPARRLSASGGPGHLMVNPYFSGTKRVSSPASGDSGTPPRLPYPRPQSPSLRRFMPQLHSRSDGGPSLPGLVGDGVNVVVVPGADPVDAASPTSAELSLLGASRSPAFQTPRAGVASVPRILRVSEDCRVVFGDQLRLEVVVSGVPEPAYQWYMDTAGFGRLKMDGETSSVLMVPDFCDDLVGTYTCHVSNAHGTVVSRAIRVQSAGTSSSSRPGLEPAPGYFQSPRMSLGSSSLRSQLLPSAKPPGAPLAPTVASSTPSPAPIPGSLPDSEGRTGASTSPQPVVILRVSEDCCLAAGDRLRLEVVASGVPAPTYQWHMDTIGYGHMEMEGENAPVLLVPDFCDDLAGTYTCHVTNPCGTVVSRPIHVTFQTPASASAPLLPATSSRASLVPVTISRVSEDCSLAFGDRLRLEVVASGVPAPTYQWHMDTIGYGHMEMEGENAPVLLVPDFCDDLAGTYTCHVTNPCGSVVSRPVRVSHKPM